MSSYVKKTFLLLLCFFTLHGGVCNANDDVPPSLDSVSVVSADQVRDMTGKAQIVDTRILHDYLAGHIPTALHIQYKENSAREVNFDPLQDDVPAFLTRLNKFIPDKLSAVVFYCNGLSCWKSYKGARAALKDGYRHVFWFRGGISEWQDRRFETVNE